MNPKFLSEFIGSAGLLIVVVGSGIMGESLSAQSGAVALLANSTATGVGLYALIQGFYSISGAHFNPIVSLIAFFKQQLSRLELLGYVLSQIFGALTGVLITHLMFGQNLLQFSGKNRSEFRLYFSELVATFGLLLLISLTSEEKSAAKTPATVACFITGAYWFTASTAFANPAVTIARSLTDSFSGILWTGAPGFIVAQILGGILAYLVSQRLILSKA